MGLSPKGIQSYVLRLDSCVLSLVSSKATALPTAIESNLSPLASRF